MIKTALIGYGYWGKNIVRNFVENPNIDLKIVCDISDERLKALNDKYGDIKTTKNVDDVFYDNEIDLVAIITPVSTHFELAKKSLLNGKHVFVEKPFTCTSDQATELIDIADNLNLIIMVDHTFLFTNSVKMMKQLVDNGELGNLYYYDSVRVNLGLFQHDVNVLWDLAPHDIAIMNYLIDDLQILSVNAVGSAHFDKDLEDVAHLHIKFSNNFIANFHVNWLSPVKIRHTMVSGDKKMLLWDDLQNDEKIKIYDKGVDSSSIENIYKLLFEYRSGDMYAPKIEHSEALKLETEHLVDCIINGKIPINDGIEGLKTITILEASDKSIKNGGKEIKIKN
jgi:predicted dehydrogenase